MATQYTLTKTLCVIGLSRRLERLLSIRHTRIPKLIYLGSCFRSNGRNHCLTVLTCWYRGASRSVVQKEGSGGGTFSIPSQSGYTVSRAIWATDDVPGLNISGNTSRTCLRISRSLFSSGVSRARTPYSVTRRWLTIAGVELCNGIHRRNSRCRDPFSYNPLINNRTSVDANFFFLRTSE